MYLLIVIVMLLVVSQNFMITFLGSFSILSVIVSVATLTILMDEDLGLYYAIGTIFLIGFSTDYCTHLVLAYHQSAQRHRKMKMKQSFKTMGKSLFSSAILTLISGAFLFQPKLVRYEQYGIVACATLGFSLVISMLFLAGMLHTCGPMKGTGDVFHSCRENSNEDGDYDF